MENKTVERNIVEEQEIDLIALVLRLWQKRRFVLRITALFAVIGIIIAITSPIEYTAKCVVMPETKSGAFSNSNMGGLAALAGIQLGSAGASEMLSPSMYSSLLKNVNLCKELVQTPLNFQEYNQAVKIIDYYNNKHYHKFSLKGIIRKYTIGLPGVIMGLFTKDEEEVVDENYVGKEYNIDSFTHREQAAVASITDKISVTIDSKNGSVEIAATMPDPIASAQVVTAVKNLLQKYVIEIKLQKAEINYNFIKQRYDEAKQVFESKQEMYAKFQDANKTLSTSLSRAKGEQLQNEYDVARELFNQLTSQLVQAEMKVKEDIPILTVVEPVYVPLNRSHPNRIKIIAVWTFLGIVMSAGYVFLRNWVKLNSDQQL